MQARWLVGGALLVLATSVAEAQSGVSPQPPTSAPQAAPTDALPAPTLPPPTLLPPSAVAPVIVMAPEERTEDYRFQLLVADVAGVATLLLSQDSAAVPLVITSYFMTPMTIHAVHGEGTRLVTSLGLRAGLPLLGGLLGAHYPVGSACGACSDSESGAIAGVMLGVITAMAVDDGILGRAHRVEKPAPAWTPRVSVTPDRGQAIGGVSLGVAGQF